MIAGAQGTGPDRNSLSFRRGQRLRRPAEFKGAYAEGRRFGNEFLSAAVRTNVQGSARLGLSIAARTVGNAVQRNRLRRLIRDSFRLGQHSLPPVDIVIGARAAARGAGAPQLRAALARLWKQINDACAK